MLRKNILLIIVGVFVVINFNSSPSSAEEIKQLEIRADAYKFIPETITVKKGDKVIMKAVSIDKDHGIGIKAFNINQVLPKSEKVTIEFIADKQGEYTIFCTKFCGWKHFFMKGTLIVE